MLAATVAWLVFAPIDNEDVCKTLPIEENAYPVPRFDMETCSEHINHCQEVVDNSAVGNVDDLGGEYMTPAMHGAHCGRVVAATKKMAEAMAAPSQEACSLLAVQWTTNVNVGWVRSEKAGEDSARAEWKKIKMAGEIANTAAKEQAMWRVTSSTANACASEACALL